MLALEILNVKSFTSCLNLKKKKPQQHKIISIIRISRMVLMLGIDLVFGQTVYMFTQTKLLFIFINI